jgi:excinuclease ABC subunit C
VRGERVNLVELALRNADITLARELDQRTRAAARWRRCVTLLGLAEAPARIECFDISHTMGEATVASCVVFERSRAGAQVAVPPLQHPRRDAGRRLRGDAPGDFAALPRAAGRRARPICPICC